jgi:hypothetical protein
MRRNLLEQLEPFGGSVNSPRLAAFAAHIPDERLAALVHMHVLDPDNLRATVSQRRNVSTWVA